MRQKRKKAVLLAKNYQPKEILSVVIVAEQVGKHPNTLYHMRKTKRAEYDALAMGVFCSMHNITPTELKDYELLKSFSQFVTTIKKMDKKSNTSIINAFIEFCRVMKVKIG